MNTYIHPRWYLYQGYLVTQVLRNSVSEDTCLSESHISDSNINWLENRNLLMNDYEKQTTSWNYCRPRIERQLHELKLELSSNNSEHNYTDPLEVGEEVVILNPQEGTGIKWSIR